MLDKRSTAEPPTQPFTGGHMEITCPGGKLDPGHSCDGLTATVSPGFRGQETLPLTVELTRRPGRGVRV